MTCFNSNLGKHQIAWSGHVFLWTTFPRSANKLILKCMLFFMLLNSSFGKVNTKQMWSAVSSKTMCYCWVPPPVRRNWLTLSLWQVPLTLRDSTLSNTRQFSLSMENSLEVKELGPRLLILINNYIDYWRSVKPQTEEKG